MRQTKASLSTRLFSSARVQSNMLDDTTPGLQTYYYPSEEEELGGGGDDIEINKKIGNKKRHSVWGGHACSKSMMCPTNDDQDEESFGLQSFFGTIDRIDQIFKYYWHQQQNEEENQREMTKTTTTTANTHESSSNFNAFFTPQQPKTKEQQTMTSKRVTYHQIRRPPTIKRLAAGSGSCSKIKVAVHDDLVRTQSVEFLFSSS